MDAVRFVKEYLRMCSQPWDCEDCPLNKTDFCSAPAKKRSQEEAEEVVRLVETWSAAHPRKTRQSVFLEQWPDTQLDKKGNVIICPKQLCRGEEFNKLMAACRGTNCYKCRREFWGKVVE